jgi:hypothetical protein
MPWALQTTLHSRIHQKKSSRIDYRRIYRNSEGGRASEWRNITVNPTRY